MSVNLGSIYTSIKTTFDDKTFKTSIGKLKTGVESVSKYALAASTAIIGSMGAMVKSTSDFAGNMVDMSDRTGMSVQSLTELDYAAKLSGTSIDSLENSFMRMTKFADEASSGGKLQTETLQKLGLTLDDIKTKSPEQIFNILTTAISSVSDPITKSALAMDVFGKSGTALLPMLNGGAAGLAQMRKEANDLGYSMSDKTAGGFADFGDDIDRVKMSLTGIKNQISIALLPELQKMVASVLENVKSFKTWSAENPQVLAAIVKWTPIVGAAALGIIALGKVFTGLVSIVGTVKMVVTALTPIIAGMSAPILVVIGVVAALVAGWVLFGDKIKEIGKASWDFIKESFNGIKDYLGGWITEIRGWFTGLFDWIKSMLGIATSETDKAVAAVKKIETKTVEKTNEIPFSFLKTATASNPLPALDKLNASQTPEQKKSFQDAANSMMNANSSKMNEPKTVINVAQANISPTNSEIEKNDLNAGLVPTF